MALKTPRGRARVGSTSSKPIGFSSIDCNSYLTFSPTKPVCRNGVLQRMSNERQLIWLPAGIWVLSYFHLIGTLNHLCHGSRMILVL